MVIDYQELFQFMTVHEQLKFMSKGIIHQQNKFMNSWISMKVVFVFEEYTWRVHEHFDERSWTSLFRNTHELFTTVHEHFMIISPGNFWTAQQNYTKLFLSRDVGWAGKWSIWGKYRTKIDYIDTYNWKTLYSASPGEKP